MRKGFVFCLILVFLFGACAENAAMLPNPITEYETLGEINEIVGSCLCHPPVMGVTDETFCVIETNDYLIAQYTFDLNGLKYTFRCAAVAYEDISGVYIGGEAAFGKESGGDIDYAFGEGLKLARWFDINGQYSLCLDDPDGVMNEETFELIAEELRDITNPSMSKAELEAFYLELEGNWQDSFSERACMTVTADGSDGAKAQVWWADSAFAGYMWEMTLRLGEDGLLYYTDCACTYTVSDDAESDSGKSSVLYEDASGFFSCADGVLYWNGAEDENCTECVFERPE